MGGNLWVTSIALRGGDTLSAYVVDSEGGLSFIINKIFCLLCIMKVSKLTIIAPTSLFLKHLA